MQEIEPTTLYQTAFDLEEFEDDVAPTETEKSTPEEPEEDAPAQQEEFEQLSGLALKLWEHCYMWNQKVCRPYVHFTQTSI